MADNDQYRRDYDYYEMDSCNPSGIFRGMLIPGAIFLVIILLIIFVF